MNNNLNTRKSKICEINNILNKDYQLTYEEMAELVEAYNKNKEIKKIVKNKTKKKKEKKEVDKELVRERNRQYYLKNGDRLKKKNRDLYASDSKHRENHKHLVRKRYENKRDEINEKRKAYYENNPQYFKEYYREYYKNNKEKYGVGVKKNMEELFVSVSNDDMFSNEEFKNELYDDNRVIDGVEECKGMD